MEVDHNPIAKSVRGWLFAGLILVFVQVLIGGVTRLTDSGLSITEWAVIQGTLPPLNEAEWIEAFDKYKVAAKKQYESLHADMTLSEFKFIFFWEYFHRLWARMMGFIFLFPFLYFLYKKMLPSWLIKRLGGVILLAMLAAVFGWIMVASGLNDDKRTWVSAYKLMTHLAIATVLFGYLFWTYLRANQPKSADTHLTAFKRFSWWVTGLVFVQILFGALMAGMKAGLLHPYFPLFVEWERFTGALQASENEVGSISNYESSASIKTWVHLLHRGTAYLLVIVVFGFARKILKAQISEKLKKGVYMLITLLGIQFLLGILTIINCIGRIPITFGVLHQGVALLLFASILYVSYQFAAEKVST